MMTAQEARDRTVFSEEDTRYAIELESLIVDACQSGKTLIRLPDEIPYQVATLLRVIGYDVNIIIEAHNPISGQVFKSTTIKWI